MRCRIAVVRTTLMLLLITIAAAGTVFEQEQTPAEKVGPPMSFRTPMDFEVGLGNIFRDVCTVDQGTQPAVYAGNSLIDCDSEVPHNETTIAVNPTNSNHIVGGYHALRLVQLGGTVLDRFVTATSVSFDGGVTWQQSFPPATPYEFFTDPALAINADGQVYFANVASHGPEGPANGASIVVARSDDGGVTWSKTVTVVSGLGGTATPFFTPQIFQDKVFIGSDMGNASPFRNRVYVTWTSFVTDLVNIPQFAFHPGASFRSPILLSYSDDGATWSTPQEISGSSPFCSFFGSSVPCEDDQFSVPSVAANGRVYVGFENFDTPAENQYMVVSSNNGGVTWSNPSRVGTVYDINLPLNPEFRRSLTGCRFRVIAPGNIASDPSDVTGRRLYAVWADNRNGTRTATNMDVFVYRSTDGGDTWNLFQQISDLNDQFFPWVAVSPTGRVDIGYMDRGYSAGQSVCQYGYTLTRFNGATGALVSKTRVDTGLSDPGRGRWFSAGVTPPGSLFIGDYTGIAIAPNGTTYSLWTDMRNVVPNPPSATRDHGQHAVAARTGP